MSIQGSRSTTIVDIYLQHPGPMAVSIETDHLFIRSIHENDLHNCQLIFANKRIMEKHQSGKTRTFAETTGLVSSWVKKWQMGNPFSGLTVFVKNPDLSLKFVGIALLDQVNSFQESELIGLGRESFWNRGYGTEAAHAIVHDYAPQLAKIDLPFNGFPLRKIIGLAHPDNGSETVLQKIGMRRIGAFEEYGVLWNHYALNLVLPIDPVNVDPEIMVPFPNNKSWCALL